MSLATPKTSGDVTATADDAITDDALVDHATWVNAASLRRLRSRLTEWFKTAARPMPWRDDPTPYHVWISEIMCQQTQVATVIPYFHRFINRYPDVASLAAAEEDELLRMWEGLGYYRRARSLKKAAEQIQERHDGHFPTSPTDVLALPGIGRYTMGAILSISQNQSLPILEGNTVRVFSRWIGYRGDVKSKHGQERLWSVAQSILPRRSVRDRTRGPASINQAAMELGALICTPKAPACDRCPVVKHCAAHEHGLESEIPGKVSRIEIEIRTEFALILRQRDRLDGSDSSRILVRQIPDGQRFAGMWDVPRIGSPEANNASAAVAWLANELGHAPQGWCVGTRHQTIKHGVTKYRITLHVHEVMVESTSTLDDAPPAPWRWMPIDELATRPINVTTRRIVKMLADEAQPLLPS